ncbi:hypothetical protein R1flu_003099 [Riccia fluitans]|uniref:Uncharacterized protein n=1 Tax=Riccia fluitans TaxID=41844 RepID=A0ABD1YBT2_9MARC
MDVRTRGDQRWLHRSAEGWGATHVCQRVPARWAAGLHRRMARIRMLPATAETRLRRIGKPRYERVRVGEIRWKERGEEQGLEGRFVKSGQCFSSPGRQRREWRGGEDTAPRFANSNEVGLDLRTEARISEGALYSGYHGNPPGDFRSVHNWDAGHDRHSSAGDCLQPTSSMARRAHSEDSGAESWVRTVRLRGSRVH